LNKKTHIYGLLLAILGLTLLVYYKALSYDFVSLDDDELITENQLINDFNFSKIEKIFSSHQMGHYLPITTISYIVQYQFSKDKPFAYRLFSLFLHCLNVLLVFKLLERLKLNVAIVLAYF